MFYFEIWMRIVVSVLLIFYFTWHEQFGLISFAEIKRKEKCTQNI